MRNFGHLLGLLLVLAALNAPRLAHADDYDAGADYDNYGSPSEEVTEPVAVAPPPLPVYVIPPPPAYEEYVWMPGHWRWNGYGYFWVPGTWVLPPEEGVLWTPGYWAWNGGAFVWNEGYWAEQVGFYGGINYGGGYNGIGFVGGSWQDGRYYVNRAYTNVPNIVRITSVTYISYNGGPGGINIRPSYDQREIFGERHYAPTHEQVVHVHDAARDRELEVVTNHGRPVIAATRRSDDFTHNFVSAEQAGARNIAAEQHNAAIRQNPSQAIGSAIPKRWQPQPRTQVVPAQQPVQQEPVQQRPPHEQPATQQMLQPVQPRIETQPVQQPTVQEQPRAEMQPAQHVRPQVQQQQRVRPQATQQQTEPVDHIRYRSQQHRQEEQPQAEQPQQQQRGGEREHGGGDHDRRDR